MNIYQLEAWNFRSFKEIEWKPSNLNVVIGPNGSGKSNLLKLLEFIQSFASGRISDYVQESGGSESILWDGEGPGLRFHILSTGIGNQDSEQTDGARYEVKLQSARSEFVVKTEELAGFVQGKSNDSYGPFTPIYMERIDRSRCRVRNLDDELEEMGLDLLSRNESALSLLNVYSQKFFARRFKRHLDEFAIYQDIETGSESSIRQARVTRHEKVIDSNGQNLINVLHTLYSESREYRDAINDGMKAAFGNNFDEIRFPPVSSQRIQMNIQWKSLKRSIPATDLSDGTLRYLFLLAVLSDPNPPSLIAIECLLAKVFCKTF